MTSYVGMSGIIGGGDDVARVIRGIGNELFERIKFQVREKLGSRF
jgi:hypothetical protein